MEHKIDHHKEVPKSGPKDVFTHLLMIATLYTATINFITLVFNYINNLFPDTLYGYYDTSFSSIRWSISSLMIVFPVYIFTSWLIGKDIRIQPEKRNIKIRRWLLGLTLFIAALVIIGDLVALIYTFTGGEITARFILKVLVVLAVAAAIFGYYLWDIRLQGPDTKRIAKKSAIAASAVVALGIILGFFVAGSPFEQRLKRFDEQRVYNLQVIQDQIISYWTSKGRLPATLADLTDSISGFQAPADPETGTPYEYAVTGPLSFRLCANFKTDSERSAGAIKAVPPVYYDGMNYNWDHAAGPACFDRTIDPERYPKRQ